MDVYLGLDLGTTSLKGILVDSVGKVCKTMAEALVMQAPQPAWAEQNPTIWIKAAEKILASIPKKYKVRRIGLSGQMHSLVPLDADNQVIRPAILWCDQRTTKQCLSATKTLGGEQEVIQLLGNPILEGFTLGKILWLKEKEAENYKRMKSFLLPKDYLAYWLTGEKGIDYSDAAGTAAFDVSLGKWNETVLHKLKLKASLFPQVQESFATRGTLRSVLAKKFGLDKVEVAAGGADNAASALGVGALMPGDVVVSVGTSGTVLAVTDEKTPDSSGRLHFFNHVISDSRYYMGVMLSAANALQFFTDKMSKKVDWAKLTEQMQAVPAGSGGLLYLPYLNGERTPHRDPNARGVLCGLSQQSDWPHILRAAMEGVSFGLRDSFELIKERTKIKRVYVVGGGAKNPLWREILAANFNHTLLVPEVDEGGAYGAAMLAAMGDGIQLSSIAKWVKVKNKCAPKATLVKIYKKIYPLYKGLYEDLKEHFKELAYLTKAK